MNEAVILAGGLGKRLRAVVSDVPKPMAPVAGRPFLSWLLRYLQMQGFRRVVLSVGYKHDIIREYFGDRWQTLDIAYAIEDTQLGTGGGLARALRSASQPEVLALNGDTFLRLDYSQLRSVLHSHPNSHLSVALRRVPSGERFGCVEVADGIIRKLATGGSTGPAFINAGVYYVPRDLMDRFPMPERFSFEDEFLAARADELSPAALSSEDPFIDIGVPESYAEAQSLLPQWICLGADRLWRDVRISPPDRPLPALFLDRDGVIIQEKNYLCDPNEVEILDGVPELIREARSRGLLVIGVTNQAGIGRGKYRWADFVAVESRLDMALRSRGAELDAVFACPYHDAGAGEYRVAGHPWRKPNPGMLFEARNLLNVDLEHSLLVGDKSCDILAARAAGVSHAALVLTGLGRDHQDAVRSLAWSGATILPDAAAVSRWLMDRTRSSGSPG